MQYEQNEEQHESFAYLDHNVLDLMTKGDPHGVEELMKEFCITPAYSYETFKEIKRSKGYENKFLDVLADIEAVRIRPLLDLNFVDTGKFAVGKFDPHKEFQRFCENDAETPESDFGLSGMLHKMYGGQTEISYANIIERGQKELVDYLESTVKEAMNDINTLLPDSESFKAMLEKHIYSVMSELSQGMITTTQGMDKNLATIAAFEREMNISPKRLNNIEPPNVVQQIMDLLAKEFAKHGAKIDMETYWGIKPHPFDKRFPNGITVVQQVNAIYHMLNFLGYHRDSNMKKNRRFIASVSDMTHAGLASSCDYFFCRDNSLVLKTAAVYEYLGIRTTIVHFQEKKERL
ncbi:hypothetical protein KIH87_08140 [Paraneptunicella aestuarii]|uniref:hypothetical protein n=1 Tax=Paraneptunicella aestuarii TaxID=2831148 RepID=UPI001E2FA5C2|nr:hypothetical protein [Paraneptunicella aestuarii]UAA40292.1 hypothetical protein KIH87_08140 [Paraneptunicella aestuarii]